MKALLDGDIFCYRTAAASEDADENICILRLDRFIRSTLHSTQADEYEIYITGENNFRYKVFPEYKANRKDVVKPKWLKACQDFVKSEWNAVAAHGCEADDHLGINQSENTIICSIDKDLKMIPGNHFNPVTEELIQVGQFEGLKNFYMQLLTGDRSDGIRGLDNVGPKKAAKYLEGCETEQDLFDVCRNLYNNDELMLIYGKCLWIWRHNNNIWQATDLSTGQSLFPLEEVETLKSLIMLGVETNQQLEPTTQDTGGFPVAGLLTDTTTLTEENAD